MDNINTNIIRNANEISNTGEIIPVIKYIEKILPIRTEEDKDSCLRLLTFNNRHLKLCRNVYNDKYINSVIEDCKYLIFFHTSGNPENIVAFTLVRFKEKRKGKILDIALVCTIPNNKKLAKMVTYSIHNFAIKMGCKFLYTVPRTPQLRETFIRYKFEPICGTKNVDEVLELEIEDRSLKITQRGKTQKVRRNTIQNQNIDLDEL